MTDGEDGDEGGAQTHQQPIYLVTAEDDVAVLMQREGHRTVDKLTQGLSDIDTKASKLMRANIVLAGLLLSGISFLAEADSIDVTPFLNSFSIAGGVLLVASIVAAGITYTETESRVGISGDAVRTLVGTDLDQRQVERGVAKAYARWIEIDRRASLENAFYVTATILLALAAVVLVTVGVFVGAYHWLFPGHLQLVIWLPVVTLLLLLGLAADVRGDYEQWKQHGRGLADSDGQDRRGEVIALGED